MLKSEALVIVAAAIIVTIGEPVFGVLWKGIKIVGIIKGAVVASIVVRRWGVVFGIIGIVVTIRCCIGPRAISNIGALVIATTLPSEVITIHCCVGVNAAVVVIGISHVPYGAPIV